MKAYTVYETATGRVRGFLQADVAPSADWFEPGVVAIESAGEFGDDGAAYYLPAGSLTARPATTCTLDKSTITADGIDTATLSSIPVGATVAVTDGNGITIYTVNDGTLEITADDPGTIKATVTPAFPYKPLTLTVTAT
jgi:hypothetical protein